MLETRRAMFRGHSYTDFAFHYILAGEVPAATVGQIGEAIQEGVASFKIFTTNELYIWTWVVLAVAIVGFVESGNDHVAEDIVNWLGEHPDVDELYVNGGENHVPTEPEEQRHFFHALMDAEPSPLSNAPDLIWFFWTCRCPGWMDSKSPGASKPIRSSTRFRSSC